MVCLLKDFLLSVCLFIHVIFDDLILVHSLHGKELLSVSLPDQVDFAKSALTKYFNLFEVIERYEILSCCKYLFRQFFLDPLLSFIFCH